MPLNFMQVMAQGAKAEPEHKKMPNGADPFQSVKLIKIIKKEIITYLISTLWEE